MASVLLVRRAPLASTHTSTRLKHLLRPPFKPVGMAQQHRAMGTALHSYLVTPTDLHEAMRKNAPTKLSTAPRIIPLCAAWFLPNDPSKRTGHDVFTQTHIPTARFFDLDAVVDPSSPYPHMLPSAQSFASAMSALGIRRDDTVVVYDTKELGIFSAPRVAWTLRVFGHPAVHILNNYRLWCEQGLPVEGGEQERCDRTEYPTSELDAARVVAFEEVRELAKDRNKEGAETVQILDARSEGRWNGTEAEPRPGLSSGHIPGSVSVPVSELLDAKTKAFLNPEELRKVFQTKGLDPGNPVISSCGTGVSATVIDAALMVAGYGEGSRRIYDGSWTEWAQRVQVSDNLIHKVGQ